MSKTKTTKQPKARLAGKHRVKGRLGAESLGAGPSRGSSKQATVLGLLRQRNGTERSKPS